MTPSDILFLRGVAQKESSLDDVRHVALKKYLNECLDEIERLQRLLDEK